MKKRKILTVSAFQGRLFSTYKPQTGKALRDILSFNMVYEIFLEMGVLE